MGKPYIPHGWRELQFGEKYEVGDRVISRIGYNGAECAIKEGDNLIGRSPTGLPGITSLRKINEPSIVMDNYYLPTGYREVADGEMLGDNDKYFSVRVSQTGPYGYIHDEAVEANADGTIKQKAGKIVIRKIDPAVLPTPDWDAKLIPNGWREVKAGEPADYQDRYLELDFSPGMGPFVKFLPDAVDWYADGTVKPKPNCIIIRPAIRYEIPKEDINPKQLDVNGDPAPADCQKFRVEIPKGWRLLHSHERVAAGDSILHPNGVEESIPSRHYMIGCGSYHDYGNGRIVIRRKTDPDVDIIRPEYVSTIKAVIDFGDVLPFDPIDARAIFDDLHVPGAKDDKSKPRPTLVFRGFADALAEVVEVATFGAKKYTDDGWSHVPNGIARYHDAMYRHLKEWDGVDPESGRSHLAHAAWNLLAVMQLLHNEAQEEQNG